MQGQNYRVKNSPERVKSENGGRCGTEASTQRECNT